MIEFDHIAALDAASLAGSMLQVEHILQDLAAVHDEAYEHLRSLYDGSDNEDFVADSEEDN